MITPSLSVIRTHVFEAVAGGGGSALIVLDSSQLTRDQMQYIAALSEGETVFALDPTQADAHARFLFYAPKCEMDMCIHGLIGAVTALVEHDRLMAAPMRIETALGTITVEWTRDTKGVEVTVEQFPPLFASGHPSRGEVAAVLRLPETAICLDYGPIESVSTGRAKLIVPVADYTALDSIQPDFETLWSLCDRYQVTGFYPFTPVTRSSALHVEARQFPKRVGFNEDPATGVAAPALGAYLIEHELLQPKMDGWQSFTIGQGYAMGRPSRLVAQAWVENGAITRTRVKGQARLQPLETLTLPAS
jgi:trans-2,3-dihydro-3-hydroxyanthranilate isomerase